MLVNIDSIAENTQVFIHWFLSKWKHCWLVLFN